MSCIARVVAANALEISIETIPSPAGAGSIGSSLTTSIEGVTWLSWLESAEGNQHALKCARLDSATNRWDAPRLIARAGGWFVNWADFPVMVARENRLLAVWFVNAPDKAGEHAGYHAEFSVSSDGGRAWSAPQRLTSDSASVEFVALQVIGAGGVLAAWLDGRGRSGSAHGRQALYARMVGDARPDVLVDSSVCDCCQLSLVSTKDGGALIAYRGRSEDETRDIRFARYRAGRWEPARTLHADGWKIAGCPVNGPQLASSGPHTVAAWFTAANAQPRVFLARANEPLTSFGVPSQMDLGRPQGRVDAVVLADGTALVTWLESSGPNKEGGIYLRAQSAKGEMSAPVLLAATTTARASGFPRMTLLKETRPARLLLSYTQEGSPSRVVTALVTVK